MSPSKTLRFGLFIAMTVFAGAALAQEPPPPESGAALVELNRAIRAYTAEDRDTAAQLLEGLLAREPTAELRVSCYYYLGLIGLERGLGHAAAAQIARTQENPEQATAEAGLARTEFEAAQKHFEAGVQLADPTAEIVSAALMLGISQLASDFPEEALSARSLSERAAQTLARYTGETDYGAKDRYGFFYLAVARYRLADDYRDQASRQKEYKAMLEGAQEALDRAQTLADEDLALGKLTPVGLEAFRTVVAYYEGLLAIVRSDHPGARKLFSDVASRAEGTDLARNASAIVNRLDEVEATNPPRIQLPVPAPIGPWEFDARLRIGNGYDSNVVLLGKDTTLPRSYRRQDDYFAGIHADFNLSRYIPKSEAPWVGESLTVGMGGGVSATWQPNVTQFDVNRYPGRAYVNWQPIRDLYFGLQYEYSYTQLGHEPYISSQRLSPVLSKIWRTKSTSGTELEAGRTDVYYTHDERNYMDRLSDVRLNRDGVYQAIGVQHTFNLWRSEELAYMRPYFDAHARERTLFGNDWLSFTLGYEYRDEQTVGTEFDLCGHAMTWGLNVPLPYRLAFQARGEFSWADYQAASLFDFSRQERADFLQRYDLSVVYWLIRRGEDANLRTLDVRLRTGVEFTFQNSNIWNRLGEDIYEYDRAIYGVTLEVDF